jgi:hypothetical protein
MAGILIALSEADGALYRVARRLAETKAPARVPSFFEVRDELLRREAGARQVDVAQMSEVLTKLRAILADLLETNPLGLLEFLERGKA